MPRPLLALAASRTCFGVLACQETTAPDGSAGTFVLRDIASAARPGIASTERGSRSATSRRARNALCAPNDTGRLDGGVMRLGSLCTGQWRRWTYDRIAPLPQ